MYVRNAKPRDEAWLLEHIEAMGLDDEAFRSREYVVSVDETTDERAGFGRLRIHRGDREWAELTSLGVLEPWREQGVGAHLVERLMTNADDAGFDVVYALTDDPTYLEQFGFQRHDDALADPLADRLARKRQHASAPVVAQAIDVERFDMPERLRDAFKHATTADSEQPATELSAEEFGIDPDRATYKYDTGR